MLLLKQQFGRLTTLFIFSDYISSVFSQGVERMASNVGVGDAVIDASSYQGRFGWETIGLVYVPYIFRWGREKHVAVRIVEQVTAF